MAALMQTDENRQSSSGLEFKLHPLVLINISDHFTRVKANTGSPDVRVYGVLLGSQVGRTVDISNSFEIKHEVDAQGQLQIDVPFLTHKQEQYKQVFPKLDVVGWYSTGAELSPVHMEVNKVISNINESPVLLLLDPTIDHTRKDLPVALYETELHVVDGHTTTGFVKSHYTVETSDAERIGVDQVAKISASGRASGSEQLASHMAGLHSALKMLLQRAKLVQQVVGSIRAGEAPHADALLRQVSSLVSSLPAMDTEQFRGEFLTEYNDALLTLTLSSMTKGVSKLADTVDKVMLAFDKSGSRRRGGGML